MFAGFFERGVINQLKEVMDLNRFHCCAACRHFQALKNERGMTYICSRLGYETKPSYKFNCWEPSERVKRRMEKEKR